MLEYKKNQYPSNQFSPLLRSKDVIVPKINVQLDQHREAQILGRAVEDAGDGTRLQTVGRVVATRNPSLRRRSFVVQTIRNQARFCRRRCC